MKSRILINKINKIMEKSFQIREPRLIPNFIIPNHIFKSKTFKPTLVFSTENPKPNLDLGDNSILIQEKSKIRAHAKLWERYIKSLIGPYELIDNHRTENKYFQSFQQSILKFRNKDDINFSKGLYPIFSRGYFKLWENLIENKLLENYENKPINIANIADGLGGFVHCLIDYRKIQNGNFWNLDTFYCITLKNDPNSETKDWADKRFQEYYERVSLDHNIFCSFGADDTGNILNIANLDYFCKTDLDLKKCQLITADGALMLKSKEELTNQELTNTVLFFAEIMYAFSIQEKGGNFVIKIYDINYDITLQLVLLLALYYEKVVITKPLTSRTASSEKYVLCFGFLGIQEDDLDSLRETLVKWVEGCHLLKDANVQRFPHSFIEFDLEEPNYKKFLSSLKEYNDFFYAEQLEMIKYGISIVEKKHLSSYEAYQVKEWQQKKAIEWCLKNKLPYIPNLKLIAFELNLEENRNSEVKKKEKKKQKLMQKLLVQESKNEITIKS